MHLKHILKLKAYASRPKWPSRHVMARTKIFPWLALNGIFPTLRLALSLYHNITMCYKICYIDKDPIEHVHVLLPQVERITWFYEHGHGL